MTSTQLSLLTFPDEILFLIAEQLETCRKDLSAFACTCIRLSEVADPCCYRRVLIKSEDQAKFLLKAVQRKPQRCAFMREFMLVPSIEHARNLMDSLHFVLEVMHRVQDLTVELPFHSNSSIAASLKLKYRYRFGDLFEAASLVSCVAKPRAFQGLRSCKLNFMNELGRLWGLGTHTMVFLHDTLESVTLVAAHIDAHHVNHLRHHKKLTPLSRLHFDHCSISSTALRTILSVPRALKSLELTDHNDGVSPGPSIFDPEELQMALSPQQYSLRHLHLGLLFHQQDFRTPYDFSSFETLQKVVLERWQLDTVLHSSLALKDGMLKMSEVGASNPCHMLWITFPQRPFSLEIQTAPGHMLTDGDVRRGIERLGRSLRGPRSTSPQSSRVFDTRLVIVRQTEQRGAVPPYLYNEHVPEKVVCYDSFATGSNWDIKTEAELRVGEEIRRQRDARPFPDISDDARGDFLMGQLNSA